MRIEIKSSDTAKLISSWLSLIIGNVTSKIIIFATLPIISRIYDPVAIGKLSVFVSAGEVISSCVALSLPLAIPQEKNDKKSFALLKASKNLSYFFSLITSAILLTYFIIIKKDINIEKLVWIIFLPIYITLSSLINIYTNHAIRQKETKLIPKTNIAAAIASSFTKISISIVSANFFSLIAATLTSQIIQIVIFLTQTKKKFHKEVTITEQYRELRRKKNFIIYTTPQQLLNIISFSLPLFFLSFTASHEQSGYYAMAMNTLIIPINIISTATFQIYYSHLISQKTSPEKQTRDTKKITAILFLSAIPISFIFSLLSPEIYVIIFGNQWIESGHYASNIIIWLLFIIVNKPMIALLITTQRQKHIFIYEIMATILKFAALAICFQLKIEPLYTLEIYSELSAFCYVALIIWGALATRKDAHEK